MPPSARTFRAAFVLAAIFLTAAGAPCRASDVDGPAGDASAYADAIRTVNPQVRSEQSRVYARTLLANAHRMHVDPRLVMAVVTVESHWNYRAVSVDGARGLGQFLPGTARDLGIDPGSGRSNLRGITVYLHQLLGLFKSSRSAMREAIAGYNAGPYAVRRYGIPRHGETPRYVVKVLAMWHAFSARLRATPRVDQVAAVLDDAARVDATQAAYWGIAR